MTEQRKLIEVETVLDRLAIKEEAREAKYGKVKPLTQPHNKTSSDRKKVKPKKGINLARKMKQNSN